jgi:alkyldihydroxyacetonephosphate synthase
LSQPKDALAAGSGAGEPATTSARRVASTPAVDAGVQGGVPWIPRILTVDPGTPARAREGADALDRNAVLELVSGLLPASQVNTAVDDLYDASADRYKKYAKARRVLDVPMPVAIVYPRTTADVARILAMCNEHGINVIPRAGKTATEGGLENWKDDTLVVDARDLNRIVRIDEYNMQATVEAGVTLQALEDEVRKRGLTTGHSPQSKPVAKLGGLVATRSIGQFSTLYGGIEDMVVGLECVFPDGHVARIKNVPRRSGGPDIRHIAIGSEGALCYITEVSV